METKNKPQSSELGEIIDMTKQLIEEADKKIMEATEKTKAAEKLVSTAL